jgi:type I restriction enzyme M protein
VTCTSTCSVVAQGYDLSLNRYKEVVHEEGEHRVPLAIIAEIERLEREIQEGLSNLKALLR